MGYSILAYLVDLDQLHQVYGSQNTDLVATIEWQQFDYLHYATREIAGLNYSLAEDGEPTVPSVHDALCRSVAGQLPAEHEYCSYGFALILLCKQLGRQLPNEEFTFLAPAGVRFLEQVAPIAALLFRSTSPGPIAFPKDFRIGHFSWEQAAQQLATWQSIVIAEDPEARAWEEEISSRYRSWLEEAVQMHRAIVTFFS